MPGKRVKNTARIPRGRNAAGSHDAELTGTPSSATPSSATMSSSNLEFVRSSNDLMPTGTEEVIITPLSEVNISELSSISSSTTHTSTSRKKKARQKVSLSEIPMRNNIFNLIDYFVWSARCHFRN
jgi:hypothetical protein